MSDIEDWSVASWEGNRLQQHREYLALPFRRKLEILEAMAEVSQALCLGKGTSPGQGADAAEPGGTGRLDHR